ncbi:MAG: pyruvate dehydrogenase complex dihydrolipoamide acetyltransferase [Bacteroidetes bacterium]|nr:pyruvate dehydrogenase complex dihydrolipoamide acetyltransferase [Bacteroidota bacterium]
MAEVIRMPKMSDTMTEGVIVAWNKKVGDTVAPGDILAEVETDKATMELENYVKGTLLHIGIAEGDAVPVNAVIAIVGQKGEDIEALLKEAAEVKPAAQEEKAEGESVVPSPDSAPAATPVASESSNNDGRVKASPLAKKMAEEKGIDLSLIQGTGDFGRIVKRDIENYTPSAGASMATGHESYDEVNVSQMRKTIARRLAESKFTAPHFYLTMEIEMERAVAARASINEYADVKVSMNDLIIKAAAIALRKHPQVNSSWLGDKIRFNHHIHVGVAMAVDEGLLVPVVKFADNKSLSDISKEVKDYSEKSRNKKLQPSDWEGNTFTISNLGMFGIEEFTAIINPPDACILAVGSVKETVLVKNGEMRPGQVMKVTLSCDHRVVDGVVGSKFLLTLKELLEEPVKILV